MSEIDGGGINWRDTGKWTRDVNGYAICPCCGAMVHGQTVDIHASVCPAIRDAMEPALAALRGKGGER